jgi:hypothetical protein
MNFRQTVRTVLWTSMLAASISGQALACACCSEPGQTNQSTETLGSYSGGELKRLRLAGTAQLITAVDFPKNVKGVAAPSSKDYRLTAPEIKREIVLNLTDPAGGTGQITFPLPKKFSTYQNDPGAGGSKNPPKSAGGGPLLSKTWTLEGPVKLSGIFAKGAKRGSAKLEIDGQGNSCTSAENLTGWTSRVSARNVAFGLLGKFAEPTPTRDEVADSKPQKKR